MKRKVCLLLGCFLMGSLYAASLQSAKGFQWQTKYFTVQVDEKGYIQHLKDNRAGHDYSPEGYASPILNLYKGKSYIHPVSARYDAGKKQLVLKYTNGSEAIVQVEPKEEYIRMQLLSLSPRNGVDNIVWGPYRTTISKTIGDILGVVRDDHFAIGMLALDDNTTTGEPCDGDMTQSSYIIHTPDAKKYPVPDSLREGQRFRIGGDGISDVAFFSHPEEYYRYIMGNGAALEPAFGSSITYHSRDRSLPQSIFFPHFNDFPSVKAPRHLDVEPVQVDYIGSAVAFYGCPDQLGLKVIEQVVKNEGLPYVTRDEKWVKDPASFRADIFWWGRQDSLATYARQLNIKAVQDDGMGEYYPNPADRWCGKKVTLDGKKIDIRTYTDKLKKDRVLYGLHTLTEFVQGHSSDVYPLANPGLCAVLRTRLAKKISDTDTLICVADTSYLNERGGWDDNRTNVLRIGRELITYKGVTTRKPYLLTGVKRGAYRTQTTSHLEGEEVAKLQVNCYSGFVPGMELQDEYADFYAKWLIDGGMDYIDFDGYESFTYQGHGQYSFKRFMRQLFDKYARLGGEYLRVMGSCVFEGTWHYMSVCNVGGGNHMFNPVTNKWGIEGKDIRYAYQSSYFPCTFGVQNFSPDWTVQVIENLQSQAIAWDATYMLGLCEDNVEKNPQKAELFKAFRTWEDARIAGIFSDELKAEMRPAEKRFHLERADEKTWKLYQVGAKGKLMKKRTLKAK